MMNLPKKRLKKLNNFKIGNFLSNLFTLDLRSLAAMRMGISILIIVDLINRLVDLTAHYTDNGILPRLKIGKEIGNNIGLPIYSLSGDWYVQLSFICLTILLAGILFFGYKTKLANTLLWLLIVSLQIRNQLILTGADDLLRLILFWGIFLPWGLKYSLDEVLVSKSKTPDTQVASIGTTAFFTQIIIIFIFAGIFKFIGPLWRNGDAIYYSLSSGEYSTVFGHSLLIYPSLLKGLTWFIMTFEVIGSILLLLTYRTGLLRTLVVFLFILTQIGFGVNMELGMFPWVTSIALVGLLPGWFWQRVLDFFHRRKQLIVTIYYDSECDFCTKIVRILQIFLILSASKIVPAGVNKSISRYMDRYDSWVVEDGFKKRYFKFQAVIRLVQASPIFWIFTPLLKLRMVSEMGERVYKVISSKRKNICLVSHQPIIFSHPFYKAMENGFLIFLVGYILVWNLGSLPKSKIKIPDNLRFIGMNLQIDQSWGLFAPYPPMHYGWYDFTGYLSDGRVVDIFNGDKKIYTDPFVVLSEYPNHRWRTFIMKLRFPLYVRHNNLFASYLCQRWNKGSSDGKSKLVKIEITSYTRLTGYQNQTSQTHQQHLLSYECDRDAI